MGAGFVVARAAAVLPETVGDAGLLLTDPGPAEVAAAIEAVLAIRSASLNGRAGPDTSGALCPDRAKRSCAGSSARFWSRWRDVGRPSCSRAARTRRHRTTPCCCETSWSPTAQGRSDRDQVPTTTAEKVTLVDGWTDPAELVILQHGIGSFVAEAVIHQRVPCVLNYHNITPAEFLEPWDPGLLPGLRWGRSQLDQLVPLTARAIADRATTPRAASDRFR